MLVIAPAALLSQDKKKADKKDEPKVLVATPFAVAPGAPAKITLRGFKLDTATDVRLGDLKVPVKIAGKGKAGVPNNQLPEKWGDTELKLEFTLPSDAPAGKPVLTVVTPTGEASLPLLVGSEFPRIAEKEPNNGFRQAQPVKVPAAVDGVISDGNDVDVFRIEAKAGDKLVFEVQAARFGSLLDSRLTLYDEQGRQLAVNDDGPDSADSLLEFTAPHAGAYFLSLCDAHEAGGSQYGYRLIIRAK